MGVQPTAGVPRGEPTDQGYTNDIVDEQAQLGVALDLHAIGCPGETTTTMLYGGDSCYTSPDSQMTEALTFLKAHHDETGLVTIDLGFNNVKTCLSHLASYTTCLNQQSSVVSTQLTTILTTLKLAAGPNVTFIGLNHDDPYLAESLLSASGIKIANASYQIVHQLNQVLHNVYASMSIPVANVAAAFSLDNPKVSKLLKSGYSLGSYKACELTWMCAVAPYGPNLHPNDAGYLAIADAIEDVLPPL